jgi:hypothetical protein
MTDSSIEIEKINALKLSMDTFLHAIKDSEAVAYNFIPLAIKIRKQQLKRIKSKGKEAEALLSKDDSQSQAVGTKMFFEVNKGIKRINHSNIPETIQKSLFLNLFSSFDAYIGELILCIFKIKPELFNGLGRQISVTEILSFNNFDELKEKVLNDEIDNLRRKSYIEQFTEMEKMFRIDTLKKFDNWTDFVEMSQRRNLLMHCNGIVSEQYIKICKEQKYKIDNSIKIGSVLKLDYIYMKKSFNLMAEVAIKLGHVLWRKIQPNNLKDSDEHLSEIVFDYLCAKDLDKAICLGKFSLEQWKKSSELMSKIDTINLAIAYKMSNQFDLVKETLNKVDWSATINDFKLANAVLYDDYDLAKEIMLKIGSHPSDIIHESAYHNFPLFYDFRSSEQFLNGYKEVFGYSFVSKLKTVSKIENDTKYIFCPQKLKPTIFLN